MKNLAQQCRLRHVPMRAVLDKLAEARDAGVDIDRLNGVTVGDLVRLSVQKLGIIANGASHTS